MNISNHIDYMTLALRLAEQGRFTVAPNPMVGCVIVKNNQIVGQGFHARAGEPHAEIFALREAGKQAQGACAYVTLEPCPHHGKTPPCTSALIDAGIKKVYVACIDPNPLVAGKGIKQLRDADILVETGLCKAEAIQLNEIFFHYITHKRPFVIAKWAMSLDGKTSVNASDNKQISSLESQYHTHQLRQQVDAILVGAHTARCDNPQLTARLTLDNKTIAKQPTRIILAGHEALPSDLKVLSHPLPGKTIVAATKATQYLLKQRKHKNVEIIILPENAYQQISLPALLDELGKREITSLLVEGGMTVHESFFREDLVNKIHVYLSPLVIGSLDKKRYLNILDAASLGRDFCFTSSFKEASHV